jgi:predicted small metal-binding protein
MPARHELQVAISADTAKELIDAAVQHAVAVHGHTDSPVLREQIGKMVKTE